MHDAREPTVVFLHDAGPNRWHIAPIVAAIPGGRAVIDAGPIETSTGLNDLVTTISGLDHYVLAGLGTGAGLAAELARRAENGEASLAGLASLVLMNAPLGADAAVSRRVGVLRTPALLVGTHDDEQGGADRQRSLVAPHFAESRLVMVPSLTRAAAAEVLRTDMNEAEALPMPPVEPEIDPSYAALIRSDRVTLRTRQTLFDRAAKLPPSPVALTPPLLAILRAAVALILPVEHAFPDAPGMARVDIARRIDQLLDGGGDGWRYATLPPDRSAAERGLRTLDDAARTTFGRPFLCLDDGARQDLLDRAEKGTLGGALDAPDMALWVGELRREAVRQWISHPAILGRLGYSGIASVRRDGPPAERTVRQGFERLGPDSAEEWEPRPC